MGDASRELRATGLAVVSVFSDRNLRLMEIARFCALLANGGSTIVFVVVLYSLGGPAAVAALAVVRLVVTAMIAPFGSLFGDRYDRRKVIVAADAARVLNLLAAAAATAWASSLVLDVGLAALTTAIGMVSSPARAALMPALAPTSDRLTAANVVASATDTVATFVGPALAGVALSGVSPAVAFAASATLAAFAPVVVSRIRPPEVSPPTETTAQERRLTRTILAGFRALSAVPSVRALVFLYSVVSFVGGALTILFAVTAIRLLDLGPSGVGFLYSFFSGGAVVGSVMSVLLIRRSLETGIVAGAIAWGLPLAAVGLWPRPEGAYVLVAVGGAGDTVASVASVTLLQRVIPDEVLSRSLGALGFVLTVIGIVGSLLAPVVVAAIGVRGALLVFGAIVLGGILPTGAWLRAAGRVRPVALDVLGRVPIFAPLPTAVLEQLAASAEGMSVAPGGVIFRAGDDGDCFYVVKSGAVEISANGALLATEAAGGSFGEIALLRGVPRTATATAPSGAELYALQREDVLAALTGQTPALESAEALVSQRLAGVA